MGSGGKPYLGAVLASSHTWERAAGGTRKEFIEPATIKMHQLPATIVTKLLLTASLLLVAAFLQKPLSARSEIAKFRKVWTQVGTRHKEQT